MSDSLDDYEEPSDQDDYEETYIKKKKPPAKKKNPGGLHYTLGKDGKKRYFGGAAAALIPPEEKPYCCKHCGARYKSKPGLNYHLAHVHGDFGGINTSNCEISHNSSATSTATSSPAAAAPTTAAVTHTTPTTAPATTSAQAVPKQEGGATPSPYCDFCLGDVNENKRTGQSEDLTSCHDCGRSGHPTCLNFTANMIISTKRYGWQCIECKSCAICGTSENDDGLKDENQPPEENEAADTGSSASNKTEEKQASEKQDQSQPPGTDNSHSAAPVNAEEDGDKSWNSDRGSLVKFGGM